MPLPDLRAVLLHRCRVDPAQPLLLGFSGGPDSLALLSGLREAGVPVIAAHLDHGLRAASADQARRAGELAGQLGAPFVSARLDVAAYAAGRRLSVEEAARQVRYRWLFEQARERGVRAVAVAHTADDQAETVLMHLLRGSGIDGLTGMAWRTVLPAFDPDLPVVRPLLATWRSEIAAYCAGHGLEAVIDESNADRRYLRNRLRHEVVPALEQINPRLKLALWQTADTLAADAAVLDDAYQRAWEACRVAETPGRLVWDRAAYLALPQGARRALWRRAFQALRPDARDLGYAAVDRAERAAMGLPDRQDWIAGLRLRVTAEQIGVVDPQRAAQTPRLPLLEPGQTAAVPVGEAVIALPRGWVLRASVAPCDPAAAEALRISGWQAWLDAGALAGGWLTLRTRRPGDRFQPLGMEHGAQKLSDFMINEKLPAEVRKTWPVLVWRSPAGQEQVAWVPGCRPAHFCRVIAATERVLRLAFEGPEAGSQSPTALACA